LEQRQRERIELTERDLIEALLAAQVGNDGDQSGAMTVWQMEQETGRSKNWIRTKLRLLYEAGRVECVRVPRTMLDGRKSSAPAYRLKVED
jgi:hypothetical protein